MSFAHEPAGDALGPRPTSSSSGGEQTTCRPHRAAELLYPNAFFDWDGDLDFDLPAEHAASLAINPTVAEPFDAVTLDMRRW